MCTVSSSSLASRWETSVMVLLGTMMRISFTAVDGPFHNGQTVAVQRNNGQLIRLDLK